MMLNQFIWGLQPELARSVILQYPKSIAQAVSLAETTELAIKASRRPAGGQGSSGQNQSKGQNQSRRGRGQWSGFNCGQGFNSGPSRGMTSGRGRNSGGCGRGSGGFDQLACYRCGVRGHLARDYPSTSTQSLTLSGGSSGPSRRSSFKSGQSGPKRGKGRGRQVRFWGINVMYDEEGNEYPIDDYGQIYGPLGFEQAIAEDTQEKKSKATKN